MPKNERGISAATVLAVVLAIVVILGAAAFLVGRHRRPRFTTPYQAVLLTNGSVYFGKLQDYGTRYPVLLDVYYVQSATNPETKQVTNVLVHRGKELHAPDRMYLNPRHIVLVEPVGPNSKIAELIAQDKAKGQ
jgi:hypothetical protein